MTPTSAASGLVAGQRVAERVERHQPPAGGLEHAEAFAQADVVEDVARVGVGLERESALRAARVGLVAGGGLGRVGVAEDA